MSKPIQISIPHELGAAEARRRIEGRFARIADQVPGMGMAKIRESWTGDRMHFYAKALGQEMSGHVDVLDREVRMEVQLPVMLAMLADSLRGRLGQAGRRLLEKK